MEISKWCSKAGCLCCDLSLSCSEKGEIMFLSDEMVLGNGVIVLGSEGIRLGNGGNGVVKRCNCVLNGGNERGGLRIRLLPTCVGHEQLQKII